jgi:hypothetical protein
MNEFGNEPLSSMTQGGDLTIGTGDDTPSPFAGFAQKEDKPKVVLKDHHTLKFFADL